MDPVASRQSGLVCKREGDLKRAFENLSKASELGDAAANYQMGVMYQCGEYVTMNHSKRVRHLEEAAIGGHPRARHDLGELEFLKAPFEKGHKLAAARAAKHWMIATKLGYDESLKYLKLMCEAGDVGKEEILPQLYVDTRLQSMLLRVLRERRH